MQSDALDRAQTRAMYLDDRCGNISREAVRRGAAWSLPASAFAISVTARRGDAEQGAKVDGGHRLVHGEESSELFYSCAIEAASSQKCANTCAACHCAQDCKDVRRTMPIVACEHINRPQESSHHVKRDRRAVSTTASKCDRAGS